MTISESVTYVCSIMLIVILLLLLVLLLVCRPWRFLSSSLRAYTIKVDDLERPLVQEDSSQVPSQRKEPCTSHVSNGTYIQIEENLHVIGADGLTTGGSHVLDVCNQSEDITLGQTLKRPLLTTHVDVVKCGTKEDFIYDSSFRADDVKFQESISLDIPDRGSCLTLEVITGPARGLCYSVRSTDTAKLPLTLGRVPPSDLMLKDSEVSGKHAMINWNLNILKWELVDMGSLNGTLLNSRAVHHPDIACRNWGEPKELGAGDVITLGTTSQINVRVSSLTEPEIPSGVGIVSDPMSMRRGGKKLPMEDVCYYKWPLPGAHQFAVFGICDGHGGAQAAQSVSKWRLNARSSNVLLMVYFSLNM